MLFRLKHKLAFSAIVWIGFAATAARATENGVSVYPAGVETVMPGMMPGPGQTLFLEFDNFYQANETMDGSGHSAVPGFHLRVAAVAPKFVHNWGVNLLGGTLVSAIALPVLYEHLDGPFGSFNKTGLSNPDISVADIAYSKGALHWWYGFDVYTPGAAYDKNDILNVGQHNFATAPEAAFTYLPQHGKNEVSSKFQYIVNYTNWADQYHSGNEFVWEYDAMHHVAENAAIGFTGYNYFQTTNDVQNGLIVGTGNRGRVVGMGPQVNYHVGRVALILKYQREMLAENRTMGNSFWFQLGMPLGRGE